jgi:hypothetical protein
MIHPALVNPFFFINEDYPNEHSTAVSQREDAVRQGDAWDAVSSDRDAGVQGSARLEASGMAPDEGLEAVREVSERYVEATAGYPCCYNCGYREPCDEHCPNFIGLADQLEQDIRELTAGFEIEPVPEFIRRAG